MQRSPKEIRKAAHVSLARVAAAAGVSEPTAKIYELSPEAVADVAKRAALDRVYKTIAETGELAIKVAS